MKHIAIFFTFTICTFTACHPTEQGKVGQPTPATEKSNSGCREGCKAKNKSTQLSCQLTTPELQKRKETVIASLKKQIIARKELKDGYAFKFPGTDDVLDELNEFIKTERECCAFFTFNLSISGDKSEAWLELTGMEGTKDFVTTELGF